MLPNVLQEKVQSIARRRANFSEFNKTGHGSYIPPQLEKRDFNRDMMAGREHNPCKTMGAPTRTTKIQELMETFKSGQISFIGPAGSGKSTLLRMIALDTMDQNLIDVKLVIFIESIPDQSLVTGREVIFRDINSELDVHEAENVITFTEQHPDEVLFILDSLDTLRYQRMQPNDDLTSELVGRPEAHIANFLSGKYLHGCRIITSGREYSIRSLHEEVRPGNVVALTGLTNESIVSIISDRLTESVATKTIARLENDLASITPLCSLPACLLYTLCGIDSTEGEDLRTLTQVILVVLSKIWKSMNVGEKERLSIFNEVESLSSRGIERDQTVFTLEEMKKACLVTNVKWLSVNTPWKTQLEILITTQRESKYFFAHKSLQETFAALHVANEIVDNFKSFVHEKINNHSFLMVRRVLYGIVLGEKIKDDSGLMTVPNAETKGEILLQNISYLLSPAMKHSSADLLEIYYCLYESGSSARPVIQSYISSAAFVNVPLSPSDLHVIGWVLSQQSKLDNVAFNNCLLNPEKVKSLQKSLCCGGTKILSLTIEDNPDLQPEGVETIGRISSHCDVRGVILQNCSTSSEHILALGSKLETINSLVFWEEKIASDEDVSAVMSLLPKVTNYLALDLWRLTEQQKNAIQDRLNSLPPMGLGVNLFPSAILKKQVPSSPQDLVPGIVPANNGTKVLRKRRKHRASKRKLPRDVGEEQKVKRKIKEFRNDTNATRFELSHIPMNDQNAQDLADALLSKDVVDLLKLRACLKQTTLVVLQNHLSEREQVPKVREVDVSCNTSLGIENTSAMGKLLRSFATSRLNLSECQCTNDEMSNLALSIGESRLNVLKYSHNTEPAIKTVGTLSRMSVTTCVTELHLAECELRDRHIEEMERNFSNSQLKVLNLRYNKFLTEKGFEMIGRIARNSPIEDLLLSDCEINTEQTKSLQKGLENKQLRFIDLSYNVDVEKEDVGADDVTAIGGLTVSSGLQKLSLQGSRLDATRMEALANCLTGSKLKILNLSGNPGLGSSGIKTIGKIASGCVLHQLEIVNCCLSIEEARTLAVVLDQSQIDVLKVEESMDIKGTSAFVQYISDRFGSEEASKLKNLVSATT